MDVTYLRFRSYFSLLRGCRSPEEICRFARERGLAAAVLAGILMHFAGFPLAFGLVVTGALAAAGVELLPLPVNDNLVIPVVSGGVMELISRIAGQA